MKCEAQKSWEQRAAASCPTAWQNLNLAPVYKTTAHRSILQWKPWDAASLWQGNRPCFRVSDWHITNKLFLETTTRFFSSLPHRKPRKGARRGEFDHCTDYVLGSSWEPWRGILILLLQSLQFLVAYGIWETAIKPTYPLPPYSFLEDMCIVCCLLKRLFMWHCRYNQVPILANVLSALEQKVL